ncbi:MAG: D-alanyl-D-alanine carboxypeptidase [Ruminococcaceae bacterium]|nr:D-alanyl-D-alanine carboxypeptidase [Oscillospiraceae bacterium]
MSFISRYRSVRISAAVILTLCLMLSACLSPTSAGAQIWYGEDSIPAAAYADKVYSQPAAAQPELALDCRAAILMEQETGRVLFEKNADECLPEASITKIMTMLLVFEALDSGRITMEETAVCSAHAASMGGSQIWLEEGEQMTVHELIKAAMVGSANDASVVLAEHIAGSHESFVAMMNARAAELGMAGTAYKNCTGLDAEGHVTTARDIAIVSAELLRHEKVMDYSTIWMDSMRGGELELVNTNKLVRSYNGITGLKTGTTSQAGCCVSATAKRDGMPLVAVIMGAPNSKTRFSCASKLLDYGFATFELLDLSNIPVTAPEIAVTKGIEKTLQTTVDMSGKVLIPKGRSADVAVSVKAEEEVCAPVEYGQTVGQVTVTLDGEKLAVCSIVTDAATEAVTFSNVFSLFIDGLFKSRFVPARKTSASLY